MMTTSLSTFASQHFYVEHDSDVTIARFSVPRLTEEDNIEQLAQELFTLVEQYERRKMVLDLAMLEFLTSAALGKMITLHRRLHRQGGKLVLCQPHPEVRNVLRSSRLIDYFHLADDLPSAVAQLQQVGAHS